MVRVKGCTISSKSTSSLAHYHGCEWMERCENDEYWQNWESTLVSSGWLRVPGIYMIEKNMNWIMRLWLWWMIIVHQNLARVSSLSNEMAVVFILCISFFSWNYFSRYFTTQEKGNILHSSIFFLPILSVRQKFTSV